MTLVAPHRVSLIHTSSVFYFVLKVKANGFVCVLSQVQLNWDKTCGDCFCGLVEGEVFQSGLYLGCQAFAQAG